MKKKDLIVVTIDGAAATGKSTTSKAVAKRMHFMHLDTGSLYRIATFHLLKMGAVPGDVDSVTDCLEKLKLGTQVIDGSSIMTIDAAIAQQEDIRSAQVNDAVSVFASMPVVREFLLQYQRSQIDVANKFGYKGLVAEGRDTGSVVFKDTTHKFYLYADEQARMERRQKEGQVDSIQKRDQLDRTRKTAPMICEEGTYCIDNTHLTPEQVIDQIVHRVTTRGPVQEKAFGAVYSFGKTVSHAFFSLFHDAESAGLDNIPKTGPFVLACNHASFYDPFLAGAFIDRHIFFFARKTLFCNPIATWLMNGFNALPLDRDEGRDASTLKKGLRLLKENQGLLLFPEGTRSLDGKFQDAKRGVGLMACKTQVPVVPAHFKGTFDAWSRHKKFPTFGKKITVVYGPPILPSQYDPGKEHPDRYQVAADRILAAIAKL